MIILHYNLKTTVHVWKWYRDKWWKSWGWCYCAKATWNDGWKFYTQKNIQEVEEGNDSVQQEEAFKSINCWVSAFV